MFFCGRASALRSAVGGVQEQGIFFFFYRTRTFMNGKYFESELRPESDVAVDLFCGEPRPGRDGL